MCMYAALYDGIITYLLAEAPGPISPQDSASLKELYEDKTYSYTDT